MHSEADVLPAKMPNVDRAIKKFSNALVFEAHQTMQNEIISNDLPILHAVNLDGNNPGIISAKSSGENKYLVHKKSKPKKEKTREQLEKEMQKAQERIEAQKIKKQQKEEEKQKLKDVKEAIK